MRGTIAFTSGGVVISPDPTPKKWKPDTRWKPHSIWPTWKIIDLGRYETNNALCDALTEKKVCMNPEAISVIAVGPKDRKAKLVRVRISDLGFPSGTNDYGALCANALRCCFSLCPLYIGAELRDQYEDQPKGETLSIAMQLLGGSVFELSHRKHDGALTLRLVWNDDGFKSGNPRWRPADYLVFTQDE